MAWKNNYTRIILAELIALIVWTICFVCLPKPPLVTIGYFFGVLGMVILAGSLLKVAGSTKNRYITNAAFPLVIRNYCVISMGFSTFFVVLQSLKVWSMPTGLYLVLHLLLAAICLWRLLAMDAGQEMIDTVETEIQTQTAD